METNLTTTETTCRFYASTEESWKAMLEVCHGAKKSIDFEQYIFTHDDIGKKFIEILIQKAAEGVKIRLLLDTVGSISFYLSGLDHHLKERGIEVAFFNPIPLWRINITSHFFRDHRKIIVVDGKVGMVGGVGVQDSMKPWRDTMVEVRGDIVANMSYVFDLTWRRVLQGSYRRFSRAPVYNKQYEISINAPRFRQRFLYHAYVAQVRNAQHRIFLATPYFVPDRRFFRALRVAAHRGVDVRLIIPKTSDHYINDYVQAWYITHALKAGIRVFVYADNFYHAKMGLVDSGWATVGSFNLDNLSFIFNHEANIISSNERFIGEIEKHFRTDFGNTTELHYKEWQRRSIVSKWLEVLTWPFHKIF